MKVQTPQEALLIATATCNANRVGHSAADEVCGGWKASAAPYAGKQRKRNNRLRLALRMRSMQGRGECGNGKLFPLAGRRESGKVNQQDTVVQRVAKEHRSLTNYIEVALNQLWELQEADTEVKAATGKRVEASRR